MPLYNAKCYISIVIPQQPPISNLMRRYFSILIIILLSALSLEAAPRTKKSSKKSAKTTKVAKVTPKAKPRTSGPWIVRADAMPAPDGLDGKNIALWASHGRYYDAAEDRWTWQRSRLMGTVEDLYALSYVSPFLAPMLENAGATVVMPRERDTSIIEVIVDADGSTDGSMYSETDGSKHWHTSQSAKGFKQPSSPLTGIANPFRSGGVREVATVKDSAKASKAVWTANIPERGEYALYVSYASLPKSATDATYRVNSMRGTEEFRVNQTMSGGTWVYLGTFPFDKGSSPVVELLNVTDGHDGTVVTADAIKIGGGMGSVIRGSGDTATTSDYPRFTEGARYWLQYAGMPQSVYTTTSGGNDYEDDFKARGLWVNYLAGGSEAYPGQAGLGVPIDLSFALHTDAGTTSDASTTIGTLPIVSTAGSRLGDGRSRQTSATYATMVTDQIIDDIWNTFDPSWTRRKMRDKAYHEAKEPQVPAMLLELLSHQNFADMTLGLDPAFRFLVSRAIYKGILKYLHTVDGTPYVVSPLPVNSFSISRSTSPGEYRLSWQPTADRLEPTATPTYYIVYERTDNGAFSELAIIDEPSLTVTPEDNRIYSYRIVAANKGGVSFPSETLALCNMGGNSKGDVTIVNGFTRVSGPAQVNIDGHLGFDYAEDMGVPYINDVLFTGEQTEFRLGESWISNDAPGHGASRATHETKIIAGNTFDFVYSHGEAVRAAGYSFVSSSVDAFINAADSPAIVDLILGKQKEIVFPKAATSSRYKPFTTALKERLATLTNNGTALMVSGSYIGSDLFDNPNSNSMVAMADRSFARDVLGIDWRQAKATITGKIKEVKTRYPQFKGHFSFSFNQELSSDCYAVESPESFALSAPHSGAIFLRYSENDYAAATAFASTTHRVVTMGFPFETIIEPEAREKLMGQILDFLTTKADLALMGSDFFRVVAGTMLPPQPIMLPPQGNGWMNGGTSSSGDLALLPSSSENESVKPKRPRRKKAQ